MLVAGCAGPDSVGCETFVPVYPLQVTIDFMLEHDQKALRDILVNDDVGERLCGWRPTSD